MAELEGNANLTEMGWHERYAHLSFPGIDLQISEVPVHLRYSKAQCDICMETTSLKPSSPLREIRASMVGELVHSALCGPFSTACISGNEYMVTLVDDLSHCVGGDGTAYILYFVWYLFVFLYFCISVFYVDGVPTRLVGGMFCAVWLPSRLSLHKSRAGSHDDFRSCVVLLRYEFWLH